MVVSAGYTVKLTSHAVKDQQKLKAVGLSKKAKELIDIIAVNPYQNPPPYEKLKGALQGKLSRRINIQHRLVYKVMEAEHIIVVSSLWSHYDSEH